MGLQVCVVGAGIIGSAIAHSAARVGAKVRVLDVVAEPGQGGSTRSTWSWLNAGKKHPAHYRDMNLAGLNRWKAEWPALVNNNICGSLVFDDDDSALGDAAYPAQRIEAAQIRSLEPAIAEAMAVRGANLYAQEAWVDPQQACAAMLQAAEQAGAQVLLGQEQRVERLLVRQEGVQSRVTGVVTADGATHSADVVILAAGAACQLLAAQAGVEVPLLHKPAVVALTQPLRAGLVRHMLSSAQVFAVQRPDGSFMLGDTRAHEDGSEAWGQSLLQRATELVPALRDAGARVERVEVAYRPWPKDGHPIIGSSASCLGLYVATMHSGMTLAPQVAALVAEELRHWDVASGAAVGASVELQAALALLQPYRLGRNYDTSVAAYGWK